MKGNYPRWFYRCDTDAEVPPAVVRICTFPFLLWSLVDEGNEFDQGERRTNTYILHAKGGGVYGAVNYLTCHITLGLSIQWKFSSQETRNLVFAVYTTAGSYYLRLFISLHPIQQRGICGSRIMCFHA